MSRSLDHQSLKSFVVFFARTGLCGAALLAVTLGCNGSGTPAKTGGTTTSGTGNSTATTGGDSAASQEISPELIKKVEELTRLTTEFNALAAKVQDPETLKQNREELDKLERELAPLVEDVMIAQAKLSKEESEKFDKDYYEKAKPLINEKQQHQRRMSGILK